MYRALVRAAALVALLGPAAHAAPERPGSPTHADGGAGFLVSPLLWVLGTMGVPLENPSALPNSERLWRDDGWQTRAFRVNDCGFGVYLELRGRVEFDGAAQIHLADGTIRTIDLGRTVRVRGLYLLTNFGGRESVDTVTLRVRARSGEAWVGVRLGR